MFAGRKELVETELNKRVRRETRHLEAWARTSLNLIDAQENTWTSRERNVPKHVQDRLNPSGVMCAACSRTPSNC